MFSCTRDDPLRAREGVAAPLIYIGGVGSLPLISVGEVGPVRVASPAPGGTGRLPRPWRDGLAP